MKKDFLVIGLGRFGTSVAKTLYELECEVMVIDSDESVINGAVEYSTTAATCDATDEIVLKRIGVENFDVVIVCVGNIENSIMIALLCKEMGAKFVAVKASTKRHANVLEKIGVDKIVFPEMDMGIKLANQFVSNNIIDYIEISSDYGLMEFVPPKSWIGKSLIDLDLRAKYDLNVIAIKDEIGNINVNPSGNDLIMKDYKLFVIGKEENLADIR